jgi:hypothetical protein
MFAQFFPNCKRFPTIDRFFSASDAEICSVAHSEREGTESWQKFGGKFSPEGRLFMRKMLERYFFTLKS